MKNKKQIIISIISIIIASIMIFVGISRKEYNAYYGLENEKIDPVTKFVIGSKEYNDYYERENKTTVASRHR